MRHRVAGRRLSRTSSHRKALRKSLCQALFQYERIKTTRAKAKEIQPMAERLITMAKKGELHARRNVIATLGDRSLFVGDPADSKNERKRKEFSDTVVNKLFREIAPRFEARNGGYTRIVKLADHRVGDGSQLVILELVGPDEESRKAPKSRRRKAAAKTKESAKLPEEKVIEDEDVTLETDADQQAESESAEGQETSEDQAEAAVADEEAEEPETRDEAEQDAADEKKDAE